MAVGELLNTQPDLAGVFDQVEAMEHENVVFCYDKPTGLKSIIAIHDTTLGPSLGGTRFWNYASEAEAIRDVLRLSRGMTYKASISGLNLGGGKAVIIGDPRKLRSEALWRRYGKFVESLNGKYITAEDVGTSTQDMEYVSMETRHVAGKPAYLGGGGDPSPVTAYGTYLGMKAGAKKVWGQDSLEGKTICIQGVGHVGAHLVELVHKEGAKILVADINETRLRDISEKYGATVVDKDAFYPLEMDIYAPCALGGTLNDVTIPQLRCKLVAGAANNQLAEEDKHGKMLIEKDIVYAPDFLINAGGLINCYAEMGDYNRERALGMTEVIFDRTIEIFERAEAAGTTTQQAATVLAMERIKAIADLKRRK